MDTSAALNQTTLDINTLKIRAKNHGFIAMLTPQLSPPTPRDNERCMAFIIGIDGKMPNKVRCEEGVEKWAELICINELNCDIDDVIWDVVDREIISSTTERFSIGSKEDGWLHETGHIIVLDKNKWLKSMQLQEASDAETVENAIRAAHKQLAEEVYDYDAWFNSEIYEATLEAIEDDELLNENGLLTMESGIYHLEDGVEALNDMLDQAIDFVDSQDENSIEVTLVSEELSALGDSAGAAITQSINKAFGFTPIIGGIEILEETSTLNFNLWLESVPIFLKLAASASEKGVDLIEQVITMHGMQNQNNAQTDSVELRKALTTASSYSDWDSGLLTAFCSVLISSIE